jgi:hypothetical protein
MERNCHMKSITENTAFEQEIISSIKTFFRTFAVGSALKQANAYKSKGYSPVSIVLYLVQLVFMRMSMYRDSLNGDKSVVDKSRDAVYRFMRSSHINWNAFLFIVAMRVSTWVNTLTSEERLSAMVLDDTMNHRPYGKKVELVSRVFDHTDRKYKRGFRSLFLGWTDGATFLPLAFRHMSSGDEKNRYCESSSSTDNRTCGGRAKKEAVMKATEVALRMLRDAKRYGVPARYVLFDSWFTHPTFVMDIHDMGFHSIGRLKNSRTRYWIEGQAYTLKELYDSKKKRRGRSKYLLSVVVSIQNNKGERMDARIVYVRDRTRKKKWIAFLCTDTQLTEEQVIELYGKRWSIEVFFKTIKTYLKFTGEFRQISYEAVTAHTSIVAIRYMIFAVEQRMNVDYRRTPGDLFFFFADEAKDIELYEVLSILIGELTKMICGITRLSDDEVGKLMDAFFVTLPPHIRNLVSLRDAA